MTAPIEFKVGAVWALMHPRAESALERIAEIWWKRYARRLVVTSARDSTHSERSFHYLGRAFDVRIWGAQMGVPLPDLASTIADIKAALGPDFDVVLERDHLHVEFDPKEA